MIEKGKFMLKVCIFNKKDFTMLRTQVSSLSTRVLGVFLPKIKIELAADAAGVCFSLPNYEQAKQVKDFLEAREALSDAAHSILDDFIFEEGRAPSLKDMREALEDGEYLQRIGSPSAEAVDEAYSFIERFE